MADEEAVVETPEAHQEAVDAKVDSIAESLRLVPEEGKDAITGEIKEAKERDPFAAVPETDKGAAEPAATTEAVAEPEKPVAAPTEPAVEDRAPDTWRKEAQEAWATTPPAVKQELVKREQDIAKYVGEAKKYQEEVAPFVAAGAAVKKMVEPFMPLLQKAGIQPAEHIQKLLYAHATLTFGPPEKKAAMFKQLASDAGIDLAALATGQGEIENPLLPLVRGLQDKVTQLEQGVTGVTSSFQEAQAAELAQGIVAFANDTENHPFFSQVADQIPAIIDSGQAKTLKDAYDLAVERNPQTRAALRDKEYSERREKELAAQKEHANRAKKALGANVKSRGAGRPASVTGSVDDTLKATLADINNRSSA